MRVSRSDCWVGNAGSCLGLSNGREAQVRDYGDQGVLVATSVNPPDDPDDYFLIAGRDFFTFSAGPGQTPSWVRS